MAVYMTGDIHGDPTRFIDLKYLCKKNPDIEWIICLGDVGLNYYGAKSRKERYIKDVAGEIPAKLFCIHGNHERRPSEADGYQLTMVKDGAIQGFMMWNPDYPNQYFAVDGWYYMIDTPTGEKRALVCGGAYSIDKYYRLECGWNWFADEQPTEMEKNLTMMAAKDAQSVPIDIMLAHTCPLRFEPTELFISGIDQSTVDTSTEEFFDELYDTFPEDHKPMWYFGHFHGNKYTDDYVMLFDDIIELK